MKPEIEADLSFNTQPPEGGWVPISSIARSHNGFNTQPPEGGWVGGQAVALVVRPVSTHSRLKAAGSLLQYSFSFKLFQHTAA